ncbi:MAG: hypothetical protein R3E46_12240 [Sedimenticolaceae bacterium]
MRTGTRTTITTTMGMTTVTTIMRMTTGTRTTTARERHAHAPGLNQSRMVQIETDILAKNNQYADANRRWFAEHGVLTLNLVSSPGSGQDLAADTHHRRPEGRAETGGHRG